MSTTVAIPTIPPRRDYLGLALASVLAQEHPVDSIVVATDTDRAGAWVTRQRALDMVRTEWTFFLDDDDEFLPWHTRRLLEWADLTRADYVFSYFSRGRSTDVLGTFGKPFDPDHPHPTTMTILVRTELAKHVGFTPPDGPSQCAGEDWRFTLECVQAGAKIVHLPEETWIYRMHTANTSGMPFRW